MKCIHVLRKPCSGTTVAANVLTHGCGAINVDACRVGDTVETWPATRIYAAGQKQPGHSGDTQSTGAVPAGRWPANLVLQHLDGCRQDGTRNVRSSDRPGHGHKLSPVHIVGPTHRHSEVRHGNLDGTETVTAWTCAEGCPVAALDEQSGILPVSRGGGNGYACSIFGTDTQKTRAKGVVGFGDTGGASRYFKQFVGSVRSEDR